MEIRSPFPGMDPWLEKHWRDIHTAMITYARDALNPQLPGGLRARMEERVFVESPLQAQGEVYPDVRVVEYRRPEWLAGAAGSAGGGAVGTEPIVIELPAEEISEPYIQIVDTESGNKVITTIEFLSPSNKRKGPGQEQYLEKQRAMRAGQVNLVEVDLLRQGQRVLLVRSAQIPATHRTTYQVCAWRWWKPFKAEVYPVPLRGPLPEVNVPLRQGDADAKLNLQELVELAYRNGRYDSIDYTQPPVPPLSPEDDTWADALLRQQKKR
jgi:hypothetical protein